MGGETNDELRRAKVELDAAWARAEIRKWFGWVEEIANEAHLATEGGVWQVLNADALAELDSLAREALAAASRYAQLAEAPETPERDLLILGEEFAQVLRLWLKPVLEACQKLRVSAYQEGVELAHLDAVWAKTWQYTGIGVGETKVSSSGSWSRIRARRDIPPEAAGALILVANDEAAPRELLRRLFVRAGFTVETFDNGKAIVDRRFQDPAPSVIVTNWWMSVLPGDEAVAQIREREQGDGLPRVPIILESGSAFDPVRPGRSPDAFVRSPFQADEILGLVVGACWPKWREMLRAAARRREGTGERVVVAMVDDHPGFRMVAEQLLGEAGIRTLLGKDGRDALRYRFGDPMPDVMIVNGYMPEMDGDEAIRQIRRREEADGLAQVPIALFTARDSREEIAAECGADTSFDPSELNEMLVEICAALGSEPGGLGARGYRASSGPRLASGRNPRIRGRNS